jgi:hypothetical protein
MNTADIDNSLSRGFDMDARFIEGWMRGTYIVAGIFAIPSEAVTIAELRRNIPVLHDRTRRAKKSWWPRGISGIFLFPFYLGTHFDPAVIAWVQQRQPYRWAVWHEPVLYDISQNAVWMRSDYGQTGCAFYPLVFDLYRRALTLIAERIQRPIPDSVNGFSTNAHRA